jgi:hypothetical protein
MSEKKVVPGLYRHEKTGNLYTVMFVGVFCGKHLPGVTHDITTAPKWTGFEEGAELVIYTGHYNNARGNRIYVRPVSEWFEHVLLPNKPMGPRFVKVPDG